MKVFVPVLILSIFVITATIISHRAVAGKQKGRDAQRQQDSEVIVRAIKDDQIDNGGSYLSAVAMTSAEKMYQIGTGFQCGISCASQHTETQCIDLTNLVTDGYLSTVPMDPSLGTPERTGYYLIRKASGALEVGSCNPEAAPAISASR